MDNSLKSTIAVLSAFAFVLAGAFLIVTDQSSDATYTEDYGTIYDINLAPGFQYTYTPSTNMEGTVISILKYEDAGITASLSDAGLITIQVKDGITSGEYDLVIKAENTTAGITQTVYQHIRIHAVAGLTIDESANVLDDIVLGSPIDFTPSATQTMTNLEGNAFQIIWSVKTGTELPAGLTLNGTTGNVSGTPTASGAQTISLTASSAGQTKDVVVDFTVWQKIVAQEDETITSYGSTVSSEIIPQTVSSTDTSGDLVLVWSVKEGTVPEGFLLNTATGVISGSSDVSKTSVVTIEGTHVASGQSVTKKVTIVSEAALSISGASSVSTIVDTAKTSQYTATVSGVTWELVDVPVGMEATIDENTGLMTLNDNNPSGPVVIKVKATAASGQSVTFDVTCQVVAKLSWDGVPTGGAIAYAI